MALEKLHSPPIVEVVCGVIFDPIEGLTPLNLGPFWERLRPEYPHHQLHPPILEEGQQLKFDGFPPLRVWMISADEAWLIQVQRDRFYVNWRQRGDTYPRFSDQAGTEGVLSRFMREFGRFSAFAEESLSGTPHPIGLELTKIDQFVHGGSWNGIDDLALMLPWLAPFAAASSSKLPTIATRFREERAGGTLTIGLEVTNLQAKLETRLVKKLDGDLRMSFESANLVLNDVFGELIPNGERQKRFQEAGHG